MNKILKLGVALSLLLLVGCQSDDDAGIVHQGDTVILNEGNLEGRINYDQLGVVTTKDAPQENTGGKPGNVVNGTLNGQNDLPLVQIGEVNPPVYQGTTLRATHVEVNGNFAYVSYNVEGNTYLGAIDVIDISNPLNPSIVMEAIFPDTDISAIKYYQNSLYLAGASPTINNNDTNPAILIEMELANGVPTQNINLMDISGYVATDIMVSSDGIFAVSGDNGVVAKYNLSNNQLEDSAPLNDLRALGQYNNKIVVLSGTDGIHIYNSNNLNPSNDFPTSQDVAASKRTIDFYNNNVLVAEGPAGVGIYNINNGNKQNTIAVPTVDPSEGIDLSEVVANAVSVESNHIFVADGAAGLSVHTIGSGISDISTIGTLDLEGSANYVKSANNYIFVADGKGGLKIIQQVTTSQIACNTFPTYTGGYWLNVNSNDNQAYSGSATLMGINVNNNSSLTFCGSLAVNKGINVNSGGTFTVKGTLAQGTTSKPNNSLNVNNNAVLQIEGSLVVYGNMILNNGATLEFLGNNSSITVYGNVVKNGNVTITGTYTDTFNSL
ncbi:hypothetical protein [Mesonia sp. K7]|uniref:hypothetical protein n=1 Tax=Mesonia sp. K7 TaxID=2218606 RepID=UPI001314F850|nr:hypothetical protein [Mesonia sp. K7]